MNLFSLTLAGRKIAIAEKMINAAFPTILDKTKYTVKDYVPYNALELAGEEGYADGAYSEGVIYINKDSLEETVIHEYGHMIHYQLFDSKEFDIPVENKSKRAFKNHKEDFAEAFKDYIFNHHKENMTMRNQYMKEILGSVCG